MATVLVVGATGSTGQLLVEQLLLNNHTVRVVVRSVSKLSTAVLNNSNLSVIEHSLLDLDDDILAKQVENCDAVVSCLGHVLSFKGMFGEPKKLCTEAVQRLCSAIQKNDAVKKTKFILMNTVGVKNPDVDTRRTGFDRLLLILLSLVIPPQRDNETAAAYLQRQIGNNNQHIEWCSVRPDSLINADISPYEIQISPTTGIFSGRPTTRANVARFMLDLIESEGLWNTWKFTMPVIMNEKS